MLVHVEVLDHAMQFIWSTDLWESKETVFADQIKRLSEINESDGQKRNLLLHGLPLADPEGGGGVAGVATPSLIFKKRGHQRGRCDKHGIYSE